jgi:hypothetical protein
MFLKVYVQELSPHPVYETEYEEEHVSRYEDRKYDEKTRAEIAF